MRVARNLGAQPRGELRQCPRQVPLDGRVGLFAGAAVHNGKGERLASGTIGRNRKEVYQLVLMHAVDLSEHTANAIAYDCIAATPGNEGYLYPYVGGHLSPRHAPVKEPDASCCQRGRFAPVEKGG